MKEPQAADTGLIPDPAHDCLSRHILGEVDRTLRYPRLQQRYQLSDQEIREHIEFLQRVATVVKPVTYSRIRRAEEQRWRWKRRDRVLI